MKKKQAKEFCILNWEWKVKNNGSGFEMLENHPELAKLRSHCGYCELYSTTKSKTLRCCFKCPIRPKVRDYNNFRDTGCRQLAHPWRKWHFDRTKENAQGVLDLIKAS